MAHVHATTGTEPTLTPLRPLSRGSGPHWDPGVRLPLEAVLAMTARAASGTLALVIDDVPTRADEETLLAAAGGAREDTILVVVPVARRRQPRGLVGSAGVTRAAWAVADHLAQAVATGGLARTVIRLVLPWPPRDTVELGPLLATAGVGMSTRVTELRSRDELDRIRALAGVLEREVDELYPPASAREVLQALRAAPEQGAVVFFTGLSGSGKSTIARALSDELADEDPRRVTLLDGDEVRQHLSRGLGFDAESRAANIDRIAWVAALIAAHGGIAIAAPIAPFAAGRRAARAMAEPHGAFLLVHVSTPLEVCEARDRKGLYARARAGEVPEFTGISSPYETPDDADVVIDASSVDVADAVREIRSRLDAATAGDRARMRSGEVAGR